MFFWGPGARREGDVAGGRRCRGPETRRCGGVREAQRESGRAQREQAPTTGAQRVNPCSASLAHITFRTAPLALGRGLGSSLQPAASATAVANLYHAILEGKEASPLPPPPGQGGRPSETPLQVAGLCRPSRGVRPAASAPRRHTSCPVLQRAFFRPEPRLPACPRRPARGHVPRRRRHPRDRGAGCGRPPAQRGLRPLRCAISLPLVMPPPPSLSHPPPCVADRTREINRTVCYFRSM